MPRLIQSAPLPFVTTAEFAAHPTYLDMQNLRTGSSSAADQTKELGEVLLKASNWAANLCQMPLHAHVRTDRARMRPDARGRLLIQAEDTPVRSVSEIAWGATYGQMNEYSNPSVWIEGDSTIVYEIAGTNWSWGPGPLQLSPPTTGELYVSWTYVAAYANTVLASEATAAATQLVVTDPLGIEPGDVLRLWDPGQEEAVTVAAGYVRGSTTVPLTSALAYTHAVGAGVSNLPPDVHLAVILYGTALLMRPDTTAEDEFPDASSSSRANDARQDGSGLVAEAKRILRPYMAVR